MAKCVDYNVANYHRRRCVCDVQLITFKLNVQRINQKRLSRRTGGHDGLEITAQQSARTKSFIIIHRTYACYELRDKWTGFTRNFSFARFDRVTVEQRKRGQNAVFRFTSQNRLGTRDANRLLMSVYTSRLISNRRSKRFLLKRCLPTTYTRPSLSSRYLICTKRGPKYRRRINKRR